MTIVIIIFDLMKGDLSLIDKVFIFSQSTGIKRGKCLKTKWINCIKHKTVKLWITKQVILYLFWVVKSGLVSLLQIIWGFWILHEIQLIISGSMSQWSDIKFGSYCSLFERLVSMAIPRLSGFQLQNSRWHVKSDSRQRFRLTQLDESFFILLNKS